MAKLTRSKELWHIPKRGSIHQTIYMVYILAWEKFLGKTWSPGKQEAIGTEMGKAGLTESGGSITHQSVRTLLANLPKYLGFVYIDESSRPARIIVTDIGYELIKRHNIAKIKTQKNLKEYKTKGTLIETSDVFMEQMAKLIITNPLIRSDCRNILVFPFRMTLRLLLELDYLDREEIAYILFHAKSEDEYPLLIEKIKNFRSLPNDKRTAEIKAYENTTEGQLTLVKAPTSGYYMYLCCSTGLCKRIDRAVNKDRDQILPAIILNKKDEAYNILKKYQDAEIYDFGEDWFLWKEYFSNPKRLFPPFNVKVMSNSSTDVLVTISKDKRMWKGDVLSKENKSLLCPAFANEPYDVIVHDLEKGHVIYSKTVIFTKKDADYVIDLKGISMVRQCNIKEMIENIEELFSGKYQGFDKTYFNKLKVIEKILGENYLDNRRRGGRLEYLFYELLELLKRSKTISDVFWYGKLGKYGICEPAPGGKMGNPDIVFVINDHLFVLELTTFRGIRAQWSSSEASSVPDHIAKYQKQHPNKKVIGVFSAPSIHHQLEQNLKLNAMKEGVGMIFIPCIDLANMFSDYDKNELLGYLLNEAKKQLREY